MLGRPLMAYPLMAAQAAKTVDHLYVSTDSPRIKEIGVSYGAEAIDRPAELCTPGALGEDAYKHGYDVIRERLAEVGGTVELMVLLFANAPTVTGEMIDEGVRELRENPEIDSAVTVSPYNMWSPLRARKVGDHAALERCLRDVGYDGYVSIEQIMTECDPLAGLAQGARVLRLCNA